MCYVKLIYKSKVCEQQKNRSTKKQLKALIPFLKISQVDCKNQCI